MKRPLGIVRALLSARSQSFSPSLSKHSAQSHLSDSPRLNTWTTLPINLNSLLHVKDHWMPHSNIHTSPTNHRICISEEQKLLAEVCSHSRRLPRWYYSSWEQTWIIQYWQEQTQQLWASLGYKVTKTLDSCAMLFTAATLTYQCPT